ncbi:MAG TPA: plastocyanin/azurin family copper-binding protein [Chloroflexota bacterium]
MQGISFDQTEVHVQPGQPVVWSNASGTEHTVTADDGSFDSGDVEAGDQFTVPFDAAGTYPYFCQYHGAAGGVGMSGVIVVDGPSDSGASAPAPAPVDYTY